MEDADACAIARSDSASVSSASALLHLGLHTDFIVGVGLRLGCVNNVSLLPCCLGGKRHSLDGWADIGIHGLERTTYLCQDYCCLGRKAGVGTLHRRKEGQWVFISFIFFCI